MIRKIANTARDYAWGSASLIPDYFGTEATGKPMAEIWFGTHAGSPTSVAGTDSSLLQLREGVELPFLLKILAAGEPLSIQAHPNKAQAEAGFAAENAAGIEIGAANRNYKDDNHKPELIVALTPFRALVGFRPRVDIVVAFQRLALQAQELEFFALEEALTNCVAWARAGGTQEVLCQLLELRGQLDTVTDELAQLAVLSRTIENIESANLALVPQLQQLYPGDPGILVTQLMNLVELQPMQGLELEAGCIHAYIDGLGVEIMANSDNVLRGGLTSKHVDIPELESVVRFDITDDSVLEAKQLSEGLWQYPTMADDYLLYRAEVSGANLLADLELANPAIVLCTSGEVAVGDSKGEREVLRKGEAAYLADARFYSFSGAGTAFLATN